MSERRICKSYILVSVFPYLRVNLFLQVTDFHKLPLRNTRDSQKDCLRAPDGLNPALFFRDLFVIDSFILKDMIVC
jgi:hypothetical protein